MNTHHHGKVKDIYNPTIWGVEPFCFISHRFFELRDLLTATSACWMYVYDISLPHFVPDGLLIVEADPLIAMDRVGNLHLIIPYVGGTIPEHLANL